MILLLQPRRFHQRAPFRNRFPLPMGLRILRLNLALGTKAMWADAGGSMLMKTAKWMKKINTSCVRFSALDAQKLSLSYYNMCIN
jgi:hypothetical protein